MRHDVARMGAALLLDGLPATREEPAAMGLDRLPASLAYLP
jgi:hypothetical protein